MRLPRDVSGPQLAKALAVFGYLPIRQTGSHIRLTTSENGEHHITIPKHDPIKIGTIASILEDGANYLQLTRDELVKRLRL